MLGLCCGAVVGVAGAFLWVVWYLNKDNGFRP